MLKLLPHLVALVNLAGTAIAIHQDKALAAAVFGAGVGYYIACLVLSFDEIVP